MKKQGAVLGAGVAVALALLVFAFDPQWCIGVTKRAVYGPPPEPVSVSLTVTPDGSVSIDGERVRDGMATKTQVTDGTQRLTGALSVYNQSQPGVYSDAPTKQVSLLAGGVVLRLTDITLTGWSGPAPYPSAPAGTQFTFAAEILSTGPMGFESHEFYYLASGSGGNLSVPFSVGITGYRVNRALSTSPGTGRENSPVYAKEVSITDTLAVEPIAWEITFGNLSESGDEEGDTGVTAITFLQVDWEQFTGVTGYKYCGVSLDWSEVELDFTGMGYSSSPLRFTGDGHEIGLDLLAGFAGSATHQVQIWRPFLADFSPFAVVDRDGELLGDLLVNGGFKADKRFAWTMGLPKVGGGVATAWGDSILLTVDQIRGIGKYSTPPGVTGLSYTDSDYQHVLHSGAALAFTMDEDSAVAHGHDPDDLEILLRVPGVDQTTCDLDAVVDWPGLNFTHVGRADLYGPEPALTHEDWVGSGGASSPTSTGEFTVSSDGAELTLALPSGFGDRLDEVPQRNFPTGMAGLPEMGYYHRADVWREYDGELGQDGHPYSVPAEARYCWRGFSHLEVPITGCSGRELGLELHVRRHRVTENHKSDSTRQEEAEHSADQVVLKTRATADATKVVFMIAMTDAETDPDYEDVEQITLSGLPVGNLRIGEPVLTEDPVRSRTVVKVFEGKDYQEGGFSAVVSPSHKYALVDYDEGNGGHDTQAEKTVRMFDYVVGASSGYDLTTAFSLASMAGILNNVCDAWQCSVNQTALDAATLDEDSNRLTSCWSFNICHPDCVTVGLANRRHRPLLQGVGGTLNCALRCRSWGIASGVLYAVRTDTVIGGAAQGLARSGYTLLRSLADAVVVWQRPNGGGAWSVVQTGVDVDAYGNWHTDSLEEFNPADGLRWEYGISKWGATGPDFSIGYAYVRETVSPGGATIQRIYLDWRRNYPFPGYARDGSWLSRFMATALFGIMDHECSADDGQTWTAQKEQGQPDGLPIAGAYRWDPDNVGEQLVPHCGDGRKWVPRRDGSM